MSNVRIYVDHLLFWLYCIVDCCFVSSKLTAYRCLGTMAILDLISIYFNQKPVVRSKFPSSGQQYKLRDTLTPIFPVGNPAFKF